MGDWATSIGYDVADHALKHVCLGGMYGDIGVIVGHRLSGEVHLTAVTLGGFVNDAGRPHLLNEVELLDAGVGHHPTALLHDCRELLKIPGEDDLYARLDEHIIFAFADHGALVESDDVIATKPICLGLGETYATIAGVEAKPT